MFVTWSRGVGDVVKLALWLRLRAALTIVIIYNVKTIAKQKYNVRTIIHVLTSSPPLFLNRTRGTQRNKTPENTVIIQF